MITARVSEGLKTEVETLVQDTGLWASRTDFIIEALDEHIRKYWKEERYAKRLNDRD
jgi:Arc/MetJ-type ribon-helix-helix transcriptional regulator